MTDVAQVNFFQGGGITPGGHIYVENTPFPYLVLAFFACTYHRNSQNVGGAHAMRNFVPIGTVHVSQNVRNERGGD